MMTEAQKLKVAVIAAYSILMLGLGWAGCTLWHRPHAVPVAPHPQYTQADGSTVAAREAGPVKPAVQIPQGQKATATARITLKPRKPVMPDGMATPPECEPLICPAITIDGALSRADDGQQDLILKSDGAVIDKATFTPSPILVAPSHPWAVGVTADLRTRRYGAFIDRDIGPIRAGIEADADTIRARVGWRF